MEQLPELYICLYEIIKWNLTYSLCAHSTVFVCKRSDYHYGFCLRASHIGAKDRGESPVKIISFVIDIPIKLNEFMFSAIFPFVCVRWFGIDCNFDMQQNISVQSQKSFSQPNIETNPVEFAFMTFPESWQLNGVF